jgi:hypothetical protein
LIKSNFTKTEVWDFKNLPEKLRGEAENSLDAARSLRQPFGL